MNKTADREYFQPKRCGTPILHYISQADEQKILASANEPSNWSL